MKAGEVYILTEESYSDYGITEVVRAVREFDFDAEIAAYRATLKDYQRSIESHGLIDRLLSSGLVIRAEDVSILHLGEWGKVALTPEADMLKERAERKAAE